MKRTLIVIIATAACTMLVACSTTKVTLNKESELTINKSSPFYSAKKLAAKSKKDFDDICKLVLEPAPTNIKPNSKLELVLADVSSTLKEGKSIIDLFPVNSVIWSANCFRMSKKDSS